MGGIAALGYGDTVCPLTLLDDLRTLEDVGELVDLDRLDLPASFLTALPEGREAAGEISTEGMGC